MSRTKAKSKRLISRAKFNKPLVALIALAVVATGGYLYFSGSHAATSNIKPPLEGLIDRGTFGKTFTLPPEPDLDYIGGVVANVYWADLQPTQGGPIQHGSVNQLDQAISQVTAYNSGHPTHQIYIKLRIQAGNHAPSWAQTLGGFTPVSITDTGAGTADSGTVGPFWRDDYGAAYQSFVAQLAASYDANPLLREVTVSQCMTLTAEPFIRHDNGTTPAFPSLSGYSIGNINNPDSTPNTDAYCLKHQIDGFAVWHSTHVSLSFSNYTGFNTDPSATPGVAYDNFTAGVMTYCRQVLGNRCVLENNSIRSDYATKNEQTLPNTVFNALFKNGPDATYQTASASNVGDLPTTLQWAVTLGANAVELPANYATTLSTDQLKAYNGDLYGSRIASGDSVSTCLPGQTGTPPNCTIPPTTPPTSSTPTPTTPTACTTCSKTTSSTSGSTSTSTAVSIQAGTASTELTPPSGTNLTQVTKVTYAVDGSLVATVTVYPYSYDYNTSKLKAGCHTLTTTVYNKDGTTSVSTKNLCVKGVSWSKKPIDWAILLIALAVISGAIYYVLRTPGGWRGVWGRIRGR